jgi:transposase InsO family protein
MLLGVSKQAFYKFDEARAQFKNMLISNALKFILEVRSIDPGIGGMKIWHMYEQEQGLVYHIGRDKFEDIIDAYNLKVRKRKRISTRTTNSSHDLPLYPNLVRDLIPSRPNQLWVGDITYVPVWVSEHRYVFAYLSIILDAYTEEIIGWSLGDTLETCYPVEALKMATKRIEGKDIIDLIHHSDRGCQYASIEYTDLLKANKIRISMTETGNPKDNPQAERINNTVKNELLKGLIYHRIDDLRNDLVVKIDFYNTRRPHMSIDMMAPVQASSFEGEIKKRWHSYRYDAIKAQRGALEIAENSLPLPCCQGSPSGLRPPVNP